MIGNTIEKFMDDLLTMGGPEKEFLFKDRLFFLETIFDSEHNQYKLWVAEYADEKGNEYIMTHNFFGKNFAECVAKFEKAKIFDGLNIYEADKEIEVTFG